MTEVRRLPAPLAAALLLAVVAVIYWPGTAGPLVLDDQATLGHLFGHPDLLGMGWRLVSSGAGYLERPVAMASFVLDAWLHPDPIPAWKQTNVLLHGVVALAVYAFAARLLVQGGHPSGAARRMAAVVAVAFALHPLQVSTVLYLVQRMTQLSALFTLLALLLYLEARTRQQAGRPADAFLLAAFLVAWPLAVCSKETGVLLPVYCLLIEWSLLRFRGIGLSGLPVRLLAAVAVLLPLALGVQWLVDGGLTGGYGIRSFTLAERLLTQPRVLLTYVGMLLVPARERMGFLHDDFPVSHGWLDPWTTLPALVCLLAAAVAVLRLRGVVGLGIGLFLGGHLLESTVIPLEMVFEHRNYLPSVGLLLAVVAGLGQLRPVRALAVPLVLAVCLLLAVVTAQRVAAWSSFPTLLEDVARSHPRSERLAFLVAQLLLREGRWQEAEAVLAAHDSNGPRLQRLEVACARDGRLGPEAVATAADALRAPIDQYAVMELEALANLGLDAACAIPPEAMLALLVRASSLPVVGAGNRYSLAMYRAHQRQRLGDLDGALADLGAAAAELPHNPTPLFLGAEWLLDAGRPDEARARHAAGLDRARASGWPHLPVQDELAARLAAADTAPGAAADGTAAKGVP